MKVENGWLTILDASDPDKTMYLKISNINVIQKRGERVAIFMSGGTTAETTADIQEVVKAVTCG